MVTSLPTSRELEALKVLWTKGKATVREVYEALRPRDGTLAYTSVLSLLQTMEEKGLAGHVAAGKAYRYFARVTRHRVYRTMAAGFLNRVFDGALDEYVAHGLQSRPASMAELTELERMIAEAKKRAKNR